MAQLTGRQKRFLRGEAHSLRAVVTIGKEGVSDAVCAATDHALNDHELIKVKILEGCPADRHEAGPQLASKVRAELAGTVGRVLILYRPDPKEPRLRLP